MSAPPDRFFGGALVLRQPARGAGYRFNVDAFLLAREQASLGRAALVIDLGAGVGAVGLTVLAKELAERVILVERDEQAAANARENAAAYGPRAEVRCADVGEVERLGDLAGAADRVVSNPPYTPEGHGPGAFEPRRAAARSGELGPFVDAAARLLAPGGTACFVYPAREIGRLVDEARRVSLSATRLRFVHATPARPARVVLVTLAREDTGVVVAAPWFERDANGALDPDLAAFLSCL